jgi:hypothetical protein
MKLQRIAQQAKAYPVMVCKNVFHLIDQEFLREAYHQTQKSSAPGMDQVTAQQYAEHLEDNLRVAARGRAGGGSADASRQGDAARRSPYSSYKVASFFFGLRFPREGIHSKDHLHLV